MAKWEGVILTWAMASLTKRRQEYVIIVLYKTFMLFGIIFLLLFHQHGELARNNIAPHHSFGLDAGRPDNLKYIEPGKVVYATGNTLVILEVATMKRRVIFGLDGGGVGCFAVHPTQKLVAIGEKGAMPNIYIYEYPSFKIAKVSLPCTETASY